MVKKYLNRYFIDAMGAMALGLFASLLIGTIFGTIGQYTHLEMFTTMASYAKAAAGMAIGVAIAHKLGAHPLVMFSCAAVGAMSYDMGVTISNGAITEWAVSNGIDAGPAGAFFAVIIAAEIGMLVSKKTKIDILVTPVVTIITGFVASWLLCPLISYVMYYLGQFINVTTELHPFLMGIIISVIVGIILTLPISSAAICASIGIAGLAGGAATAGCCAQMIGFAVMSFKENKVNGLISQGLGTSMLQMGNICKNPKIWIPPILASAICGPLATCVFKLECTGVSAGMGTCGLVGPIGVIAATEHGALMWTGIILVCFVLPAVLSVLFAEIMRKIGWIKENDLKLED
ncbi:MAG: PTS sugar transporter subunit IIC [Clostridia bacterium]|nr:PTS sugar transporter subunit IIC [Clostridia bacterium]